MSQDEIVCWEEEQGSQGDVVISLGPWAAVNSGSIPVTEGLMFRAGMMVPGDEDGNFIPDACDIPCIGNRNGDDLVDSADLGLALGYWGPCPSGHTP